MTYNELLLQAHRMTSHDKDYQKSIELYTEAINISPNDYNAYHGRGIAKNLSTNYKAAIEDYNIAISIDPGEAKLYLSRASSYKKLKRYSDSLKDYDKAIELDPHSWNYKFRGDLKYFSEYFSEAIEDYTIAISLGKSFPNACLCRGLAKNKLNDITGAIKDYDEAIRRKPDYAAAYLNRGLAKIELNLQDGYDDIEKGNSLLYPFEETYFDDMGDMWVK